MVNYISSLYLGKRRNEIVQKCMDRDPFYLLKSQMLSFHKFKMDGIHKVTFVLNPSENAEAEARIDDVFEEYKSLCANKNIEYEILRNPDNKHISYGAWHYGVINGLSDDRTKYFYLMEDDYVPCADNFHQPYIEKSTTDVAYVCQLWTPPAEPNSFGRIAMTNGLLRADLSRKIFEKYGRCFMLDATRDYEVMKKSNTIDETTKKYLLSGPAQKYFMRFYQENGYKIVDLGSDWKKLFLNSRGVKVYGEGNDATVSPIHEYVPITIESFI